jgi:hypothetical protein
MDDAVRALCATTPAGLCALLGIPMVDGARVIRQSESVPSATLEVDALLVVGALLAVHIEFQTRGQQRHLTAWSAAVLGALPDGIHRIWKASGTPFPTRSWRRCSRTSSWAGRHPARPAVDASHGAA